MYPGLRRVLADCTGSLLDVGCGEKPYRPWAPRVSHYFGIDVKDGPEVDAVIEPGERWPVESGMFDVVLCTQALEHVSDFSSTIEELVRAVRSGGVVIISMPFIYNEHGSPHDYRRLSRHGAAHLSSELEVISVARQGAIGSTLAILFLNWLHDTATSRRNGGLVLTGLLPIWVTLCGLVNATGWVLDRIDHTGNFYSNVLVVARKRQAD
jgi:SAM-dependent methyltransferase